MKKIEILPLGGIGEFGMNCLGIRYGHEMIVVDAGMGFPEESAFGVDICVPDFSFLDDYRNEIRALILTHGHEDHIGAVPYFIKNLNVPLYASRLTAAFIEEKFIEHKINNAQMIVVEPREVVKIGNFEIEFINASHSLIECFSLAIKTPCGTIIHTGDYKIDDTPVIGEPYDLETLRRYGDEGVLAVLGDSTNSTIPGRTPSEMAVIPDLEKIFLETKGRLFITTFSSSFHRLQILIDLAFENGRSVCLLGRSMLRNFDIGISTGLLDVPNGLLVNLDEAKTHHGDQILYLATGSQGEQRSAMWSISTQSYKGLQITEGDTIVISARYIPGNELRISKMIGAIYRLGGKVVEHRNRVIHVSGHAYQEDIRILMEAARPKFLVPVHGEYRMLYKHKEFAVEQLGYSPDRVILIENGDVLELDQDSAIVTNKLDVGRVFIESDRNREIDLDTIRERKKLALSGIVSLVIPYDSRTNKITGDFSIEMQGINERELSDDFEEQAIKRLRKEYENMSGADRTNLEGAAEHMRIVLRKFVQKSTAVKPVVIPNLIEVNVV